MAAFMRLRLGNGGMVRLGGGSWKTALCESDDWQGIDFDDQSWESARPVNEPRTQPWPKQSAFLLRRAFQLLNPVRRARIYATALGAYELYLNGARVGDALLTPESTDFRKRVLYRVYEVTDMLRIGENALGAI